MCKILGISFKEDTNRFMTQYYLRHFFAMFGPVQPHGWGFSFHDGDGKAVLFKEPVPAQTSPTLRFLLDSKAIQTKYVVGHVRFRSVGPIIHQLTQPFAEGGFIFSHNGTLSGLSLGVDESDSLYMFKELLKKPKTASSVISYLKHMNQFGAICSIVSDGSYLLAYRDKNASRPLHYRKIKGGYLVSSLPMESKKKWKEIAPGYAMMFVDGELVDILR